VSDGTLEIRRVRIEDAAMVAKLLTQLGYPASVADGERRLERLLASEADVQLAAVIDDEVVGLAGLQVGLAVEYDAPVGKLSELVVEERHRSRGVGRALIAAVEQEARRRGCCLLYLTTAIRRQDAHAFYESVGFEETGKRFVKILD
jgi:GNAT superfamily N-acetyltransferase